MCIIMHVCVRVRVRVRVHACVCVTWKGVMRIRRNIPRGILGVIVVCCDSFMWTAFNWQKSHTALQILEMIAKRVSWETAIVSGGSTWSIFSQYA